jgi:hypothetical protein
MAPGGDVGAEAPTTSLRDATMTRPSPHLLGAGVALAAVLGATQADAKARGPKRHAVGEIIVHATGGPSCQRGRVVFSPPGDVQSMARFFAASAIVSIHYIVGRDGTVAASVPEDEVAHHTRGNNEGSVGIELINAGDGREAYPPEQIDALVRLVAKVRARWRVPLAAVKGHEDVDHSTFRCGAREVRRKQDPGALFPWDAFRASLAAAESPMPVARRR